MLGSQAGLTTVTWIWSAIDMAHKSTVGIHDPIRDYEKTAATIAEKILFSAETLTKEAGISVERVHVQDQHPAEGITEAAQAKGSDLIVMASHGRGGIQNMLLGSVAAEIQTHSKIPVLIAKQ